MSDQPQLTKPTPTFKGGQEKKLAEELAPLLDPGETVYAAIVAQPRGSTQAVAGAHALGMSQAGNNAAAAAEAGLIVARPMGLAITDQRLITIKISTPIGMGLGGKVKGILSSAPLDAITSIESRHWKLGQSLTLQIGKTDFKLEMNARASGPALAEAFTQLTGR